MKTGRPGYYIPSPAMVSRDVKKVFIKSRQRIAKMLQVYHFVSIDFELIHIPYRNMTELLALQPMHGPLLIIRHL